MPNSEIRLQVKDFNGHQYDNVVWPYRGPGFWSLRPNNIRCACGAQQWLSFDVEVRQVDDVEPS